MTGPEQASLDRLDIKIDAGFREIRELMEARRVAEAGAYHLLADRLAVVEQGDSTNKTLLKLGAFILTTLIAAGALAVAVFVAVT